MTEAKYYRLKAKALDFLLIQMIGRLEFDEASMRDLIAKYHQIDSDPDYNTPAWQEKYGIPFEV